MNALSPIVLFVYNRPLHTQKTVEALQKNKFAKESELYIYADGPKNELAQDKVAEVRAYLKSIKGFKKITIIERTENWGLAKSIIHGVTEIINQYGTVIVLEDDLVTSPYFLKFMNDALTMYKEDIQVACIHGYIYPIADLPITFFIKGADCWGWATWQRAWKVFEHDGNKLLQQVRQLKVEKEINFNHSYDFVDMLRKQINHQNDSWAIRWYISAFLVNMLCLYPGKSLVKNIGMDGSGIHCSTSTAFDMLVEDYFDFQRIEIKENTLAKKKIEHFFLSYNKTALFSKLRVFIRKILK